MHKFKSYRAPHLERFGQLSRINPNAVEVVADVDQTSINVAAAGSDIASLADRDVRAVTAS